MSGSDVEEDDHVESDDSASSKVQHVQVAPANRSSMSSMNRPSNISQSNFAKDESPSKKYGKS